MQKSIPLALALFTLSALPLQAADATSLIQNTPTEAPAATEKARAFFVDLKNNDKVAKTFTVKLGIEGMKLAPAGISKPGTGHFHLFIDADPLTGDQLTKPIPVDMSHIDLGKGQTEINLTLPTGKHKLQVVMGNGAHKLHSPPVMSEIITVIVE